PPLHSAPPLFPYTTLFRSQLVRSLRTDEGTNSRVVAVPAGNDAALVMSTSLESTQQTLAQLSLVLVVMGGAGILLAAAAGTAVRSEEHTSELQSRENLVCR